MLAATDELTGIFYRRQFNHLAGKGLAVSAENNEPSCYIGLDLDHFKASNDTYGHDAGDAVLVAISKAWGEVLRGGDLLGRMGGEEFSVFLPNTSLEQGLHIEERIKLITSSTAISIREHILSVTVSLGITCSVTSSIGLEPLAKEDDLALYS